MVASGMQPSDAEGWIAAWESAAPRLNVHRDASQFWAAGAFWIEQRRAAGRR
jgi:hypothetical protein